MSREETIPTMRAMSSDDKKMRCSLEANSLWAKMCRESAACTETTLNLKRRLRRCSRSALARVRLALSRDIFERHSMNSATEQSMIPNSPSVITHFRSATETTFEATTPPIVPESSTEVTGQTVRPCEAIVRKEFTSASSCKTADFIIVSLQSNVRADRDFIIAVGPVNLHARKRKSRQEKTYNTWPLAPMIGTRLTRESCRSRPQPEMNRNTVLRGVLGSVATNSAWPEQLARRPTGILLALAKTADGFSLLVTTKWLTSI
mmetsp:Transcript_32403/g.60481  ORF Transcript_32403/g.60481 Transcript_32403/m.60481 type:complete len:262 (-) Transcript_32403:196-981(-)